MTTLIILALTNALVASAMFLAICACRRWIQSAALLHALWVLVLLKLVTPPLWTPQLAWPAAAPVEPAQIVNSIGIQPRRGDQPFAPYEVDGEPNVRTVVTTDVPVAKSEPAQAGGQTPAAVSLAARATRWLMSNPLLLLLVAWTIGSLVWLGIVLRRILRFQRCLSFAEPAAPELQSAAASLAAQLGLRHSPRVWLVPGCVSPMLWAWFGPAQIILPKDLLTQLDAASRETLLLHELAHYRRGDHWVRRLELVCLALYWWLPILWLLGRALRAAEEQACDAWVVSRRPADRRAYAEMLVTTLGFLSAPELPAVGSGIGGRDTIESRLTSIMRSAGNPLISPRANAALWIAALAVLPLAPAIVRAQRQPAEAAPVAASGSTAAVEPGAQPAEEEIVGTVVDEAGMPVAGIEITPRVRRDRILGPLRTDATGQFRVPGRFWSDDTYDFESPQASFIVRDGEKRMGWIDLQRVASLRQGAREPGGARDDRRDRTLRIVLLERTRIVRGTLVDGDNRPLTGISVEFENLMHPANQYISCDLVDRERLMNATTDAEGGFQLALPAGASGTLLPMHPDWQRIAIQLKPDQNDLGRIRLTPAARIEGVVVDSATGKPLAGEYVLAQAQEHGPDKMGHLGAGFAQTDADGRFVVGGLSPGRFNVLFAGSAFLEGKPQTTTAVAIEGLNALAGRPTRADLRVIAGRRLAGKVVDATSGQPLAKIHVGSHGLARPQSGAACMMTRTKADGSYEFYVPPGVTRIYVAEATPPIEDSNRTLDVPADRDLVDIVLKASPAPLRGGGGRRVDEEVRTVDVPAEQPAERPAARPFALPVRLRPLAGMPVNQVSARLVFVGSEHTSQWSIHSGTDFEVHLGRRVDGREAFLLIDAAGFAAVRTPSVSVRERMDPLTVDLVAEELIPLRGRVVDAGGKPVAGARIRVARLIYGTEKEFPWGVEYTTDADGRYEIKRARFGDQIRVRVDKPGTGGAESDWLTLDDNRRRIIPDLRVGEFNQELGGIVRDYEGLAVAGARVSHRADPQVSTTTSDKGEFLLRGLPAGELELAIDSAGFPRDLRKALAGRRDAELLVNRISEQDRADYRIKVAVRARDNTPLPKASLHFCVDGGELLLITGGPEIEFASQARSHRDQQFVIVAVAEGYAQPKPVIVPNRRTPAPVDIVLDPRRAAGRARPRRRRAGQACRRRAGRAVTGVDR